MPSKTAIKMRNEDWELELPISMIDVVFLLLIFFICTLQFKSVERKLDCDLPKDEGQNPIPKKVEVPTEIRVKIYWANSKGQVIHNATKPFPDNWNGVIVPSLTCHGHHIEMKVNQMKVPGHPNPNLNELARTLETMSARNPNMPVVLDSRMAVPFKYVIGALDACARAKVRTVKFQSPPVEGGGGADWWWM